MNPKFLPIRNLAELKRTLQKGAIFMVVKHRVEHLIGKQRVVNIVKTVGVYTHVKDEPNHEHSICNGGRGSYLQYGKADEYEFGETVKYYITKNGERHLIMEFGIVSPEVEPCPNCKSNNTGKRFTTGSQSLVYDNQCNDCQTMFNDAEDFVKA